MSKPLIVSIPHSLGKEEAMRRLRSGLSRAATSIPLMKVDEETWTDNRMSFRVQAMGQIAKGTMDVEEDHVTLNVTLPWLLAKFANAIQGYVQTSGRVLLEKK
jgi:Putative polyhydroxyalkanoic acid system protein (PHA_gran_rgn)